MRVYSGRAKSQNSGAQRARRRNPHERAPTQESNPSVSHPSLWNLRRNLPHIPWEGASPPPAHHNPLTSAPLLAPSQAMCPGSSSWSVAESELVWVERLHAEPPSYTHTPLIQEPGHRKGLNLPLTRATRSQETTESDRGSKDAAGEVGGSPDAPAGPRCPATASRPWALARAEGSRLNCSAQTRVVGGYVGHHLRRCYIDRKDNKGHSSETESPLRARRQAGQHRANAVPLPLWEPDPTRLLCRTSPWAAC